MLFFLDVDFGGGIVEKFVQMCDSSRLCSAMYIGYVVIDYIIS